MSPACIGNLNVGSLPFSLFSLFFSGDYHGATPICRGTNRYGTDDASFDIFPKGFLYLLFVVIWYWNRVVSSFAG